MGSQDQILAQKKVVVVALSSELEYNRALIPISLLNLIKVLLLKVRLPRDCSLIATFVIRFRSSMRLPILLLAGGVAAVQDKLAESVCNVVTKTVTGEAYWHAGAMQPPTHVPIVASNFPSHENNDGGPYENGAESDTWKDHTSKGDKTGPHKSATTDAHAKPHDGTNSKPTKPAEHTKISTSAQNPTAQPWKDWSGHYNGSVTSIDCASTETVFTTSTSVIKTTTSLEDVTTTTTSTDSTKTTTTLPQGTDTYTTTTTVTVFTDATATATSFVTIPSSTTTATPAVVTIPTPPGFTPLPVASPSPSPLAKRREIAQQPRDSAAVE